MFSITTSPLPYPIFSSARQNECGVVILHERMITPLREKWDMALWVDAENAPYRVIPRLFGPVISLAKLTLLMPCLAHFQYQQRRRGNWKHPLARFTKVTTKPACFSLCWFAGRVIAFANCLYQWFPGKELHPCGAQNCYVSVIANNFLFLNLLIQFLLLLCTNK